LGVPGRSDASIGDRLAVVNRSRKVRPAMRAALFGTGGDATAPINPPITHADSTAGHRLRAGSVCQDGIPGLLSEFPAVVREHPKLLRVVALSGRYSHDKANTPLARNHGVIASFSRAVTECLAAEQDDRERNRAFDASTARICRASVT
jgi:hypothetical protein